MSRVEHLAEGVTLYLGDCREILPTLRGFDAVVTDPPYGIEDIVGGYGRSGETIENDRNLDCCAEALAMALQSAPDALWAVFYSPRIRREFLACTPTELRDLGEIIWDKKAPGMGRGIRYQHETVAIFASGAAPSLAGDTFSVIRDYRSAETHPHQKPIGLVTRLCEITQGAAVLDPFMGSGTTGVAAARLGLRFAGCELDPKHFETACRRISEELSRPQLLAYSTPSDQQKVMEL